MTTLIDGGIATFFRNLQFEYATPFSAEKWRNMPLSAGGEFHHKNSTVLHATNFMFVHEDFKLIINILKLDFSSPNKILESTFHYKEEKNYEEAIQ